MKFIEISNYWIRYFNSIENGYNETDALYKCGGNTYRSKTDAEMEVIEEKIRRSKLGKLNPMARQIKLTDVIENNYKIFDTIISCAKFLGIKGGKTSITVRLNGKVKSLFRKRYKFEYCNK